MEHEVATGDLAAIDLTDLDLFSGGFPHEVFARFRAEAPVWWHEPTDHTPDGEGFWSVATHAETRAVLNDPVTFSSVTGGDRPFGGTLIPDSFVAGHVLNMMDDPRHGRMRRLVNKGFTPKMIGRLEDDFRARAAALVDAAVAKGEGDFLVDVAMDLPLQAISMLLGVPQDDRHRLAELVDPIFDFRGRDAFEDTAETQQAFAELLVYGTELVAQKRTHPTDDVLSVIVHAELPDEDPPRLADDELHFFFTLLFAAGADTTRNATAGGLLAMIETPGSLERLRDDRSLVPTAVEEMLRWTSPTAYNRRTATVDVELCGHSIRAGDKVVFWEPSANRDAAVFAEPDRFDVARDPNPHVAFGHGAHHCLGANLARLEMRVVVEELLGRVAAVELVGPPEWTRSNKHTGLRHLPVRIHAA